MLNNKYLHNYICIVIAIGVKRLPIYDLKMT